MIQFNLLPDVKISYLKAKRTRNLFFLISSILIGVCIVFISTTALNVYVVQRNHISNLTEDIDGYETKIKDIDQINRILTVQNQLMTIDQLHDDKPVATRLFGFFEQVTPSDISLNRVEVDMDDGTITLAGQTETLALVNRFVDTLKFTNIIFDDEEEDRDDIDEELFAFSDVVLTSFSRDPSETSFVVNLNYDKIIFDSQSDISLLVPDRITTRSEIDRPSELFQAPEAEEEEVNL